MTPQQILILVILIATAAMFLWDRWRHDMVAVCALLTCVVTGLISGTDAFAGFGHPAVVTVACVLILSSGLKNSGAVSAITHCVVPTAAGPTLTILALTALAALLSAFMNNVGALALLMPVALQTAAKQELPPGKVLMPVAFGSLLGGMTTLIGTPPNLIVSSFRRDAGGESFAMFDYTPVGLSVALIGVLFIGLIGWRLVPARKQAGAEGFDTGAYLTEIHVPEGSDSAGKTLRKIETALEEADAQILGVVRNEVRVTAPSRGWVVRAGDILIIEAEAKELSEVLSTLELKLAAAKDAETEKTEKEDRDKEPVATDLPAEEPADKRIEDGENDKKEEKKEKAESGKIDENVLMELAVLPGSALLDRSASDIMLRSRYGINLLAVSRQGQRSMTRLRSTRFAAGDLLLMQGTPESLLDFASNAGCVPLAERELRIPDRRKALTAGGIMAAAIGGAAFGLLPAAISFAAGVLAAMVTRTVPPRAAYDAVDWPVIVLLGALIPVAGAMESTGAADLIARFLIENIAQGNAVFGLALILIVAMTLSDLMNNAATAAVMCPIAIGTASQLGVNADAFLMAVAIGSSCAFLTPIGHQNNTLILGPGGFRFGDYWKLGLPLEILVVAVSIPVLLIAWPLK